ncbi:MAG TPA: rhomboid family intramembrane serine protease [Bacilli bacterium]|nr:rhomboid family intramembrane serine protease [Bacilli bacterium]
MNEFEQTASRWPAEAFLLAQELIAHDDFTILPQFSRFEQGQLAAEPNFVQLVRRRVGGLQFLLVTPADGLTLEEIKQLVDRMMHQTVEKKDWGGGVSSVVTLHLLLFTKPQSAEFMAQVAEFGGYQGIATSKKGVVACAVDLARGVFGPRPEGAAVANIDFERLEEPVRRMAFEPPGAELQERTPAQWEAMLSEFGQRKAQGDTEVLRLASKTTVTYTLLALTALVYLWVTQDRITPIYYGLMWPEMIRLGELWRLLTPVFLHAEFQHFLFNMIALYSFGQLTERIYGWGRFTTIYLLSGISGSLLSFAFGADNPALGASGAIFGLFGAMLAFGVYQPRAFKRTIGPSIYALLGINIAVGFIQPNIDYWAHFGGLIGGFLVAYAFGLPGQERKKVSWIGWLGYGALAVGLYVLGMA